jgi:cysteine peptidase B
MKQDKYKHLDLSEQYLLSCTSDSSCDGGYLESVFETATNGIPRESDYPYDPYGIVSPFICWTMDKVQPGYIVQASYGLTDAELETLLQTGPVAISVSSVNWLNYGSGVFKCRLGDRIDHAVLLVGYTPTYWIIKNSWGTDWGQRGFIYITKSRYNNANCGIGTSALYLAESFYHLYFVLFILLAVIF